MSEQGDAVNALPGGSKPPALGSGLRLLREKLGLSQTKAARRVGVTLSTWGEWERGKRFPHSPGVKAALGRLIARAQKKA